MSGSKPYNKVLNFIIDICGVKYFRTVRHVQAVSFSKKKKAGFFEINNILRNNHILTEVIIFSGSASKIR